MCDVCVFVCVCICVRVCIMCVCVMCVMCVCVGLSTEPLRKTTVSLGLDNPHCLFSIGYCTLCVCVCNVCLFVCIVCFLSGILKQDPNT